MAIGARSRRRRIVVAIRSGSGVLMASRAGSGLGSRSGSGVLMAGRSGRMDGHRANARHVRKEITPFQIFQDKRRQLATRLQ